MANAFAVVVVAITLVVPGYYTSRESPWWVPAQYLVNLLGGVAACLTAFVIFALAQLVITAAISTWEARRRGLRYWRAYNEVLGSEAAVLAAAVVLVFLTYGAMRWLPLPGALHAAVMFGSLVVYAFAGAVVLHTVALLVFSLSARHLRSRHPDGRFVVGLAEYIDSLGEMRHDLGSWAEKDRRERISALEEVATEFKFDWPNRMRTGHLNADNAAHEWGRRVAAAIYAKQLPILLGVGDRGHYTKDMADLLGAFLAGDPGAFPDDESDQARSSGRWHQMGRSAAILLTALVGVACILVGVLQPELPDKLAEWGWPGPVVNRLRLGHGIQPPLLTVGAAFLGLAARLVTPQLASQSPFGRKGR
ncbi:hypothetical protein ACQPZJ_09965 [Actinoplanes sp. CA-054009]